MQTETTQPEFLSEETSELLSALSIAEQRAFSLVYLAHVGHGFDLGRPANRRVALRWWSEFLPSRVLIAARTCSTVGEFMTALCRRLQGQIGGKGEVGFVHRQAYARLANLPTEEQAAILDVCERQSAALVTLVRAEVDEQKQRARGNGKKDATAEGGRGSGDDAFDASRSGEDDGHGGDSLATGESPGED